MRIRKPGKIREGLWFLGREESGIYILEGETSSMIVSGGMSYLVPDVLQQMEIFGIDPGRIKRLLILHSHFDHVGIVPFFKRRCPGMEVLASPRGWEVLRLPKAVKTINHFSRSVTQRMGKEEVYLRYDLDWREDVTGKAVCEGEIIDLGGVEVLFYETPGHSSCCLMAYVPSSKILFPSDGGGIPFQDVLVPSGNSNYSKFQESLEKVKNLETDFVCADHYGYIVGEEARTFIRDSMKAADEHRRQMEEAYRGAGNIDGATGRLVASFYKEHPGYFLSPEIFEGVYRQMVRHIVAELAKKA